MAKRVNIKRFRKLAQGARRCVWSTPEEAIELMGDRGEGEFLAYASPQRILAMLDELEALRALHDAPPEAEKPAA
jgi:hypothetical protein